MFWGVLPGKPIIFWATHGAPKKHRPRVEDALGPQRCHRGLTCRWRPKGRSAGSLRSQVPQAEEAADG